LDRAGSEGLVAQQIMKKLDLHPKHTYRLVEDLTKATLIKAIKVTHGKIHAFKLLLPKHYNEGQVFGGQQSLAPPPATAAPLLLLDAPAAIPRAENLDAAESLYENLKVRSSL